VQLQPIDRAEIGGIAVNTRWGHLDTAEKIRVNRRRRLALAAIAEAAATLDATGLDDCGSDDVALNSA
jgi:hypothetical protein